MISTLTIKVRITHTRNLPQAETIAYIAGAALTEILADDPLLLATGTIDSAALANDDKAPTIRLPGHFASLH